MSSEQEDQAAGGDDGLLPRLRLIEDQPLEQRADAYAALHEELRVRLEGADPSASRTRDDKNQQAWHRHGSTPR
ncbi:hypothetical protein GCM10027416_23670 [Okibacterium endophyticum]